ncbi:MAG: pyrroline-5-carboxylate reductase [Rhodospirillales bacterium]
MSGFPAILLVGCGKMGRAMLDGWLEQGLAAEKILIAEPYAIDLPPALAQRRVEDAGKAPENFKPEIVVLAVKPQSMAAVLPGLKKFAGAGTVFLSIAAGKTLAALGSGLGEARIVRTMPNTPAAVRQGITVAVAGKGVDAGQRDACDGLLRAVGEVMWVQDEGLLDAVTAVSGSGPAYVFLLAEAMAEAGVKAGLPRDLAEQLARATVSGSGELLRRSSDSAAQLRQNVTSPGGTTAEALKVLMAPGAMQKIFDEAIAAATRRSRELAG